MSRNIRLGRLGLLALASFGLTAFTGSSAASAATTITGLSTSSSSVVSAKAVSATVTPASGSVTVTATLKSTGADVPAATSVSTSGGKVTLKLTTTGLAIAKSCGSHDFTVRATTASGAVTTASGTLSKSSSCTKATTVPAAAAGAPAYCEFVADAIGNCLLPYPSNFFTKKDASSGTGVRVNLNRLGTITNTKGVHVDPAEWNRNDGFSITPKIVVTVPGLVQDSDSRAALASIATNSGWPTIGNIGSYSSSNAAVVLVDKATGTRVPVWAELDSSVGRSVRPLLLHPAVALKEGHTYVVGLQKLKTSANVAVPAPKAFALYRDSKITSSSKVEARRGAYEDDFAALGKGGVTRANLQLAWEFTTQSTASLTRRMLSIRNQAFALLGDTNLANLVPEGSSPAFTITSTTSFTESENSKVARRVVGRITTPCYLTSINNVPCAPGSVYKYNSSSPDATPVQNGTYSSEFRCEIPRSAFSDRTSTGNAVAKPPVIYGHGLLGGKGEVGSDAQVDFADQYGYLYCATDEAGFASEDVGTAIIALGDLSHFNRMADRTQQGLLNELYLGRALVAAGGLRTNAAFQDGSGNSLISGDRLFYDGNSQGGILGGALTAIAPDFDHAVLGVNGMSYSTLLDRSKDFVSYNAAAYVPNYTVPLERSIGLSLAQDLWDRGEPSGYVNHMTTDPLPNTPAHNVLMQVGLGDFQVANITADTEARTIGAKMVTRMPSASRVGTTNPGWNIPFVTAGSGGWTGSALVYFDSGPVRDGGALGNSPPIFANAIPVSSDGHDPHEHPRRSAQGREMKSGFLRVGGTIKNTCGSIQCLAGGYAGP